jgi:hypothetical protein
MEADFADLVEIDRVSVAQNGDFSHVWPRRSEWRDRARERVAADKVCGNLSSRPKSRT